MTTWVLVLTLWGWTSQSGKAITHIDGFKSQTACVAAGQAWLDSKPKGANSTTSALCLQQ
jgi:hypothetical protein